MPGGRPTIYDPAYCERVIELGKEGCSVVEMASDLNVSRNTLETSWPAEYPEFLEAFTKARAHSQAWWESMGRKNLIMAPGAGQFQGSVWSRSMAARFPADWRESTKSEITGKDGEPLLPVSIDVAFRGVKPAADS
jgi:transposase